MAVLNEQHAGGVAGQYFQRGGIISNIGGFAVFASMVLSWIYISWWAYLIIFVIGFVGHRLVILVFRQFSQPLSVILVLVGLILALVRIY